MISIVLEINKWVGKKKKTDKWIDKEIKTLAI